MMTETEWKVTWFPDDKDHVVKTSRSRRYVQGLADKYEQCNPIIESREVVTGDWEIYKGMPATQPGRTMESEEARAIWDESRALALRSLTVLSTSSRQ